MLKDKAIRQSMCRMGSFLDNAVVENFFGLLQSELLKPQDFQFMEHFKQKLIIYVGYYNNRSIKVKERACRLPFTDNKAFRLLDLFFFENMDYLFGVTSFGANRLVKILTNRYILHAFFGCVVYGRCVVQKWHFNDTKQHRKTSKKCEKTKEPAK